MARYVSLSIIAALIFVLGATFFQVIAPFLMPLFLAAMTALFVQPVLRYFLRKWPERRSLASAVTTVCVLAPVMLPLLVVTMLAVSQLLSLAVGIAKEIPRISASLPAEATEARERLSEESRMVSRWIQETVDKRLGDTVTQFDLQMHDLEPSVVELLNSDRERLREFRYGWMKQQFEGLGSRVVDVLGSVAVKTLGIVGRSVGTTFEATVDRTMSLLEACIGALLALVIYTMALFYFLADGPDLVAAAQALIPVERDHQNELMLKFESSVRAVVLATFLAAVGQGLATAICLWLAGFNYFFVLLILATIAALIPLAGTPLVWVPAAVWLGIEGHWGAVIFVTVFCAGFVGFLDNVIRTWVLKSDTSLHPLLAFVSVLGGLQVMGLWGVFIGPIVACCLHALMEIFNSELEQISGTEGLRSEKDATSQVSNGEPVALESTNSETATGEDADKEAENQKPVDSAGDQGESRPSDAKEDS